MFGKISYFKVCLRFTQPVFNFSNISWASFLSISFFPKNYKHKLSYKKADLKMLVINFIELERTVESTNPLKYSSTTSWLTFFYTDELTVFLGFWDLRVKSARKHVVEINTCSFSMNMVTTRASPAISMKQQSGIFLPNRLRTRRTRA